MASSFITYKQHGFWVNDRIMEIVAALFFIQLKDKHIPESHWMNEFKSILLLNASGNFNSHMHFDLDEFLIDEQRINDLIEVITEVEKFLSSKQSDLDLSFIEDEILPEKHWEKNNWRVSFETSRLIKVLIYLELLIFGKLGIKVDDRIFYSF